jgi:UDP-N-acetylmuramate-alanine ligase
LFKQFVKVLSPIRNLLVYKTFAAREYFDDAGSALTLSQSLKKSHYADCVSDIAYFLSNVKKDDLILFLGAGDIYDIAKCIVNKK